VNQLRSPLTWRLILWLILLAIIPLFTLFVFMNNQTRTSIINARLDVLGSQVRAYSARLESNPKNAQAVTTSLTNITPNSTFFVIGSNGRYIVHSDPAKVDTPASDDLGFALARILLSRDSTAELYEQDQVMIASFRTASDQPTAVILVDSNPTLSAADQLTRMILFQISIGLLIMAVAGGIILMGILSPSLQLAEFAKQLGKRNFIAQLDLPKFKGEMGIMAKSLTDLSVDIQAMTAELEQKVGERTRELEKRAVQLKAAADVGKAITSVRNLADLMQQTTLLIQERFGYYHVGIFLLDERKEYAVLSASNSEGGKRMLERQHKLKVSETSIVGYATLNATARIALDVGQDAVYFDNPDLPNTRSEMALPLVVSGQTLGALDVQSTEPSAFTEEDVATLQILAEQLAVAIQNANLFDETEKALEAARQGYGEASRDAWGKILRNQPRIGYIATPPGTTETHSETPEHNIARAFETGRVIYADDGVTVSVPIKIRGQSIGAIRLKKSEITEAWTQDEVNLAVALTDQLSGALESARLYRESQQRAVRESLVSDISARISAASRVETIIRETVQELGQTIGNAKVSFQMADQLDEQKQAEGPAGSERKAAT
jgi:GAF domain-containing protein